MDGEKTANHWAVDEFTAQDVTEGMKDSCDLNGDGEEHLNMVSA